MKKRVANSLTKKHLRDEHIILGALRISLGLIFFWAFIDKLFGLGFATAPESSWLNGGSPTAGFLQFGVHGPFTTFYNSLANISPIIDWVFMVGLLLIGLALIFGIMVKIASYSGAILMLLMWLALVPPEHHPFLDDHIIYAILLVGFALLDSGDWLGFGKKWSKFIGNRTWLK